MTYANKSRDPRGAMQKTKCFSKYTVRPEDMDNQGEIVLGRVKCDSQNSNWNRHACSNFSVEAVSKQGPRRVPPS